MSKNTHRAILRCYSSEKAISLEGNRFLRVVVSVKYLIPNDKRFSRRTIYVNFALFLDKENQDLGAENNLVFKSEL